MHSKNDPTEVEGILKSIKLPYSEEWREVIHSLVLSSTELGILRAHFELLRLKEFYEFQVSISSRDYSYQVILPKEALEFIKKYSYEVGVITEETILERLRKSLQDGLKAGDTPKEMQERIQQVCGTWMSQAHAETIARTETGKFYNAGRLARWLDPEVDGFVEALQYDAILDRRTTPLCKRLDGKIIPATDRATISRYTPPNHFRCRSTWIPVTKYEEWENTWGNPEEPDKGFKFASPLPKLLEGKKEPLVQVRKKTPRNTTIDPLKVTDPDVIRSLKDDDFKVAIGSIKDQALKLNLIKERAEMILKRDYGLKDGEWKNDFRNFRFTKLSARFKLGDQTYYFDYTDDMKQSLQELAKKLAKAKTKEEMNQLLDEYAKKHKGNTYAAMFLATMRQAIKDHKGGSGPTWKGLQDLQLTDRQKERFTIKTPPRSKYYKQAKHLQEAVERAQEWIYKHLDPKLIPETGVTLKYEHRLSRAYARGSEGTIHFGYAVKNPGVIIHETAHILHWNNKAVADLINEFFQRRTKNEPMSTLYGENVKKDEFFHAYIGRVYGFEYRLSGSKYATSGFYGQEVLSMGMQAMYENPMKFYQDDKEHFLLIFAIMRGLF